MDQQSNYSQNDGDTTYVKVSNSTFATVTYVPLFPFFLYLFDKIKYHLQSMLPLILANFLQKYTFDSRSFKKYTKSQLSVDFF